MVLSKGLLTLFFFGALLSHPLLSQILMVEDFSSASGRTPPTGWTNILESGVTPDDLWSFSDPYVVHPLASISGGSFATFPGYFYSEDGQEEHATLISPWVKVRYKDRPISLAFYHYYFISEARGGWSVSVRKNRISNWLPLAGAVKGESGHLPELAVFDLSAIVGSADSVQVKFEGYGQGGLAWIVDDVTLAQGTLTPPVVIHQPQFLATCSFSPVIEAHTPDLKLVRKAWVKYWVDGIPQDSVNMTVGATLSVTLSIKKPSSIEYQIVVEDTTSNNNKGYSPQGLANRHHLIVGSTPTSEIGEYWKLGQRIFASTEGPISNYFQMSRLSFPLYSKDPTDTAISIITYPIEVKEGFDYLFFQRAYSGYGNISDTLRWYLSTDGGSHWTSPLYEAYGERLRTVHTQITPFSPTQASDWVIDGFSLFPWVNQCVQLRIEAAPGYGNNLYLDNLHFAEAPKLAASILDVYPNPSDNIVNVDAYIPPSGSARLSLVSAQGQLIYAFPIDRPLGRFTTSLDVSTLGAGLYALVLQVNGKTSSVLIVVL